MRAETESVSIKGLVKGTGERGTFGEGVLFKAPFAEEPVVYMSLTTLDVGRHENLRISVQVDRVDCKGFAYTFSTWSDTDVHWAVAHWIAISDE